MRYRTVTQKRLSSWLLSLAAAGAMTAENPLHAQNSGINVRDVEVTEDITTDTAWTNDRNYLLGGPVWVRDGASLTIEPGTRIYGYAREGAATPGALVVTRGSQLIADGTRNQPIVFTALAERNGIDDDGDPSTPNVPVTLEDSSLWGGVVLLGNAVLNTPDAEGKDFGEYQVEGFPDDTASELVSYGGNDDDDNSGVLRYLSIRYGGAKLATDNEINGLTLGAVGRGTTIEYIEVFNNSDDGVEFFGGTVDVRYMVMAFNEDEAYDIDQGYRGRGQFLFAIQKDVGAGSNFGGEHDGGDAPDATLEPFARNQFYNVTWIGGGPRTGQENGTFRLKDNYAGQYHNSIFQGFKDYAVRIDDANTAMRATTEGDLSFENNLWYDFGSYDGTTASLTLNGSPEELAQVSSKGNLYANPFLGGISRRPYGGLDPRPFAGGPAFTSPLSSYPDGNFFEVVSYRGAFDSEENWMTGWTYLSQLGYFKQSATGGLEVEVMEDITGDTVWTSDKTYLLGGPIWVRDGANLTIEAGTMIYGYIREGAATPGALVVTRGSKIFAEGTRHNPIVFTALAERDGIDDDGDPTTPNVPLTLEDSSLWGGVVVLGNAVLNTPDAEGKDFGEYQVEGFPDDTASELVSYGGNDDEDDSGILRYVSIRFGGSKLATDNEINGLTLGAVGRGTTIEYIEVFNNSDDGVEFFGGTVNTRYMVMAFNEDEAYDIDQGFRGLGQFWFAIQKDVGAGSNFGGEHDGGDAPDTTLEPLAEPKIYNATWIGGGPDTGQENGAFRIKDNFAGQYHNSVFTSFKDYAIRIDDANTAAQATAGRLRFDNNTWWDFGTYDGTLESLTLNGSTEELLMLAEDRGNTVEDPLLFGINRKADRGLSPFPTEASPLWSGELSEFPEGSTGFYTTTDYRGAFGEVNWAEGWSHLWRAGYMGGRDVDVVADITEDTTWTNDKNYLLGGPIWVRDGVTLTIEPGTTVYGYAREGAATPGALIVIRGSKLIAAGTKEQPITFTALAERDGIDDDGDPETPNVPVTLEDSSLWGGLVLLGNAVLNTPNAEGKDFGEYQVEGFPDDTASELVSYGGNDDDDDSGILRYLSLRYGGSKLATDNEINGLTLGAVGRGTTIEYVEVFNNSDDGVEFFGGTVDVRYMVMAFNEDEAYDIDQGYRGRGQFLFAIQKDVGAGSNFGGEHDGGDAPDTTLEPFARHKFYNVTWIGGGPQTGQENGAFRLKDNYAGQYHNSIFQGFKDYAVRIDDANTAMRANTPGDLSFENNLWYDFGSYDGTAESLTLNGSPEEIAQVVSKGNRYADPLLGGISRAALGGLDPRPSAFGPAYTTDASPLPDTEFFSEVDYKGAFSAEHNWMAGWTHLSRACYLGNEAPANPTDVEVVEDITEDTVWTNDKTYLLGGPIWVRDGAILTIQAGTKILGYAREGAATPGALVVTRESRIIAEGTRENPIIFTARAERDGIDDDGDPETPNVPVTLEDSSLWGGLVLLGNAVLNTPNAEGKDFGEYQIEGFPDDTSSELVSYGGNDDDDDSGVLRYVSIRYGGSKLATDNEINGLTLGAVGRGTTIEYIEVFNNSDDGVEFFGGTVDVRYMVMAFNEDEAYDIDQGYRGRGQFLFAIQKDVGAGSNFGGEHDGGDAPDTTLEPFARHKFYNATWIGGGPRTGQENGAFRLKDNYSGQYHNSIFQGFKDYAVRIDDANTAVRANTPGDLSFENNLWYDFGSYDGTAESLTLNGLPEEIAQVSSKGNQYANPFLGGISRRPYGGLDPRPLTEGPAYRSAFSAVPADDFFASTEYKGAFDADNNWMRGWTRLEELGYFDQPADGKADVEIVDDIIEDTVWTNDRNYVLGGPVWVREGANLTIEAGTTVYGYTREGAATPGALVVTRGSKIFAEGTRHNPIVFTALAERDGIDDDGDPNTSNVPVTLEDSSLWGGVVVLGNAVLNTPDAEGKDFGEYQVEGFPDDTASELVSYGGNDDEDDSGILRYVSIRFGGSKLATDNEINGLTLGAVGRGTTIEYIEVFNNSDDGVEFFGGTVNTRYMVMAFNEDEAYDIDQGFRGLGQFWFAIQKDVGAGSNFGGEHDGGDAPDTTLEPLAEPKIYNATWIGGGPDTGQENGVFRIKDNFAGQYHNSVFTSFKDYAIRIDDANTAAQATAGRLRFDNNTWWDFGTYDGTLESLTLNGSTEELLMLAEDRGNTVEDPMLTGISRSADGGLNPLPADGSPLLGAPLSAFPAGTAGFYATVDYRGAFGEVNWAQNWTHLSQQGYLGEGGGIIPDGDSDGDGVSDDDEAIAGTDPDDPFDYFHVMAVTGDSITWSSKAAKSYDVQYSETLEPDSWMTIETVDGIDGATSFTETDVGRLGAPLGFYRVAVE